MKELPECKKNKSVIEDGSFETELNLFTTFSVEVRIGKNGERIMETITPYYIIFHAN